MKNENEKNERIVPAATITLNKYFYYFLTKLIRFHFIL